MEKKGNNDPSAVFELVFTLENIHRLTTADTLTSFAENFKNSKFVCSVHEQTIDKCEHVHIFFFAPYSQKKKKVILDSLLSLTCFEHDKKLDLEHFIQSNISKLEKETHPQTAREIFLRRNCKNIVPKNSIASRSSFFHLAFRLDEQLRGFSPDSNESETNILSDECCFKHLSEKDKERVTQISFVFKSTPLECERTAIFKKIKESCKTRFENFILLKKLIELTKVKNLSEFNLAISEEERIAILCGIQGWETLIEEIFTNAHFKELRESSTLSYPEKLYYFFGEYHEQSRFTDTLRYQVDWLEQFLLTNKIRIKAFLKYLIVAMDTSHLIVESENPENAYAKRVKIKRAVKIKTTYIFGKTSVGKSLLADLILTPMKATSLLISNRSFSLSPLKRPINSVLIQELSPQNLESSTMKKLFGGEEIEVCVI